MYLINTASLELEYFQTNNEVPYAVLSHRWHRNEITHQDIMMRSSAAYDKHGYGKMASACAQARFQGLPYLWVDTCCIDKTSSAELSEAINSMFAWYHGSQVCLVYLDDVSAMDQLGIEQLEHSAWFTRGWTLQELLAPKKAIFFNRDWVKLGSKTSLGARLSQITRIPPSALEGRVKLMHWTVAQRMSWAAGRVTTRPEDRAYSLMGIFGVNMPLLYGEGDRAFMRLQEEIILQTDDHSIFAWHFTGLQLTPDENHNDKVNDDSDGSAAGLLAPSPDLFADCSHIERREPALELFTFSKTNRGISIHLPLLRFSHSSMLALLNCTSHVPTSPRFTPTIAIFLRKLEESGQYARSILKGHDRILFDPACWADKPRYTSEPEFKFDIRTAHAEVLSHASKKPIAVRATALIHRNLPAVTVATTNLFIRQNPMDFSRFQGPKLYGYRIRRFTPFPKGYDFDPQTDCSIRCLNDWNWDSPHAILPDPYVGDLCRIYIPEKKYRWQFDEPPPDGVGEPDRQGMYRWPAICMSFGFSDPDEYMPSFAFADDPPEKEILPMMSDPRSDVQVLSEARPQSLWATSMGHPGEKRGNGGASNRRYCFSTEIVDGVETKILDVLWSGPWSRCDGCGKIISDQQFCCVSCSSPQYDCCTECFSDLANTKHDAKLGNRQHRFRMVKLNSMRWGKRIESSRLL